MRIALINEDSQANKNELIYKVLKEVAEKFGHTVDNYGMFNKEDKRLTYVQEGLVASVLLNSKACDFVITGCGTADGATLAMNSFDGVQCAKVIDPSDAFLFSQINNGNAIALPFAKGFGWGAEVNLKYVFERLFGTPAGGGFPISRAVFEQENARILTEVKKISHTPILETLKGLDEDFVLKALNRRSFKTLFLKNAKNGELKDYIVKLLKL